MLRSKSKAQALAKEVSDNRIRMMADRLAILLTICNARDEDDWNPWALDRSYDGNDSMGDHIRRMKDYSVAKGIVRRWIEKVDEQTRGNVND